MKKAISVVAVILMLFCVLSACGSKNSLSGTWTYAEDDISMSFIFNEDGTGEVTALEGLLTIKYTYDVKDNTIIFHEEEDAVLGTNPYTFSIEGNELSLSAGGDTMVLTKEK